MTDAIKSGDIRHERLRDTWYIRMGGEWRPIVISGHHGPGLRAADSYNLERFLANGGAGCSLRLVDAGGQMCTATLAPELTAAVINRDGVTETVFGTNQAPAPTPTQPPRAPVVQRPVQQAVTQPAKRKR